MPKQYYGSFSKSIPQRRFSLWLPDILYERIATDAAVYGVHKAQIVKQALIAYYRSIDNGSANIASKPVG